MWGQEDHSHWRSLIHQPQTAELSRSSGGRGSDELRRRDQQDVRIRSSGGRGSDELRRRDQQDVRIRWGSAQVCLPPTKQDQVRFSSGFAFQMYGFSVSPPDSRLPYQLASAPETRSSRAFSTAPPPGRASISSPTRQGLQRGSSTRQGLQRGSSISSFSHGFLVWLQTQLVSAVNHLGTQYTPPPASEVHL
ncbi:unnamed protein product [Boreogadus saida]